MQEYILTINHHGYDPRMARQMKGIIDSFYRLTYGQKYKIDVDAKQGVLHFPLRSPEDVEIVSEKLAGQKSLKRHGFRIDPVA